VKPIGAFLQEGLVGLNCSIETLTLSELEAGPDSVLDALEPIRCLISVVGTFEELRRLAGHREVVQFPLVVDLTEETQHELVNLPQEATVGSVAEEHLLSTRRAMVTHYRGTDANLMTASLTNDEAVDRIISACPIIIHSLAGKYVLLQRVPRNKRLIELKYHPNGTSLARLRALVHQSAPPSFKRVQSQAFFATTRNTLTAT
jgi:hypothetical protein